MENNGDVDYKVEDAENNTLKVLDKLDGSMEIMLTNEVGNEVSFVYNNWTRGSTILAVDGLTCPFLMGLPFLSRHRFLSDTGELAVEANVQCKQNRFKGIDSDGTTKIRWVNDRMKDTTFPVYLF